MMKKGFLIALTFLTSACATHYVKTDHNTIVFYLKNKKAKKVELFTNIDNFKPHKAKKIDDKTWIVTLTPNRKTIKYFYKIDGKIIVPDCKLKENDDFGGKNCIYQISS